MTKVNIYSETGKKKESVTLPKEVLADANIAILAQALRVFENHMHLGISRVKTRGEIVASKRKIYKQKGTGGARHGAKSAPIFVGGGIAHGPTGNKRVLAMPLKMRNKALQVALGVKAEEGTFVLVDGFTKVTKAKNAQQLFDAIIKEEKYQNARMTVALSEKNKDAGRALRNLRNASVVLYKNLNAHAVIWGGTLVVDAEALVEGENDKKANAKSSLPDSGKKQKIEQAIVAKESKEKSAVEKKVKTVSTKKRSVKPIKKSA